MQRLIRAVGKAAAIVVLLVALVLGAAALWASRLPMSAAAAFPPAGKLLTAGAGRLHYIDVGNPAPDAPVVVLIHGNPGAIEDFDRLIPALSASHRVIAFDRPGHGYSERADLQGATPTAQAAQLHDALDQLGVRRPILVGHSWGGMLALAYALQFPDDVAGLLLLGTKAYSDTGPPDPLYALLRRPVVGPLLRHTVVPFLGRGTMEARMAAAFQPDSLQRDHLARARALWMRPDEIGATVWDSFLRESEAGAMSRRYASVGAPVMILVGDGDSLLPESQQLANQLPNAWIQVLPRTGHYLPRTRVAEVQRSIAILQARLGAGEPARAGSNGR
jgi:pimeloyl-ACP methyl ester carboxylesterase